MTKSEHKTLPQNQKMIKANLPAHMACQSWSAASTEVVTCLPVLQLQFGENISTFSTQHNKCFPACTHEGATALTTVPNKQWVVSADLKQIIIHQVDDQKGTVTQLRKWPLPIDCDAMFYEVSSIRACPDGNFLAGAVTASLPDNESYIFVTNLLTGHTTSLEIDDFTVSAVYPVQVGQTTKIIIAGENCLVVDIDLTKMTFSNLVVLKKEREHIVDCTASADHKNLLVLTFKQGTDSYHLKIAPIYPDFKSTGAYLPPIPIGETHATIQSLYDGSIVWANTDKGEVCRVSHLHQPRTEVVDRVPYLQNVCVMPDGRIFAMDGHSNYCVINNFEKYSAMSHAVQNALLTDEIGQSGFGATAAFSLSCIVGTYAYEDKPTLFKRQQPVHTPSLRDRLAESIKKLMHELPPDATDLLIFAEIYKQLTEKNDLTITQILSAAHAVNGVQPSSALTMAFTRISDLFKPQQVLKNGPG